MYEVNFHFGGVMVNSVNPFSALINPIRQRWEISFDFRIGHSTLKRKALSFMWRLKVIEKMIYVTMLLFNE
jgi:hypothetical protein